MNENCKCDKPRLFTPDTLADGYEAALFKGMERLSIRSDVQTAVKDMRRTRPNVYLQLCYLAKEESLNALRIGINILAELEAVPDEDELTF